MTYILGISAFYHDSAAALIKDGDILSAVQEERFTRIRHDLSFPYNSIFFCLNDNNLEFKDIDIVVFYDHTSMGEQNIKDALSAVNDYVLNTPAVETVESGLSDYLPDIRTVSMQ